MLYSAERGTMDTGTIGFKCHVFSRCAFETEILGKKECYTCYEIRAVATYISSGVKS